MGRRFYGLRRRLRHLAGTEARVFYLAGCAGDPGAQSATSPASRKTGQSNPVVVAVIDTGIDAAHPDIQGQLWTNPGEIPGNGIDDDDNGYIDDVHGWDFVNNDNDPHDGHGHGAHVAGTIAAATHNTLGIAGLSWGAKIMTLKGLSDSGSGPASALAEAVIYAADNGAHIINNSWGGLTSYSPQVLEDAFAYAASAGCLSIASAGNDGTDLFARAFPEATFVSQIAWCRMYE